MRTASQDAQGAGGKGGAGWQNQPSALDCDMERGHSLWGGGPRSTRASTLDLACADSADVVAIRCERNYRGETGAADPLPRRPPVYAGKAGAREPLGRGDAVTR